ncbi:iron-containing redox enzyme family protein [Candidatus Woesearchaeota archaeon]|nr:iron-containing redox enzyme family protein [Candidatus Woesearchaeota archaeon]
MSLIHKLDARENELIERFHRHPFFRGFGQQSDASLRDYLVQKWFLSTWFIPWYDKAISTIRDLGARDVLREIVFEEFGISEGQTPATASPTHREDLLADLAFIGIPQWYVLNAKPTKETIHARNRLEALVDTSRTEDSDLRTMVALRVAGEILVAEEYRHVVPELERRYGLTRGKSRFYAPHFYHDRKDRTAETEGQHTESFVEVINRMITDDHKLDIALESAQQAYDARISIFDQFTAGHRIARVARHVGVAAAVAAFAVTVGVAGRVLQPTEHEAYARFVASLPPTARAFYADADRRLLDQYEATGDQRYLANLGTLQGARDIWGAGP